MASKRNPVLISAGKSKNRAMRMPRMGMMTKLASKARPIRFKLPSVWSISPLLVSQRYRQHVHHNEQVAQEVDVFWNLFQVFSDLSLNGVTDCQMRRLGAPSCRRLAMPTRCAAWSSSAPRCELLAKKAILRRPRHGSDKCSRPRVLTGCAADTIRSPRGSPQG
jgi:hypothetical protein